MGEDGEDGPKREKNGENWPKMSGNRQEVSISERVGLQQARHGDLRSKDHCDPLGGVSLHLTQLLGILYTNDQLPRML